MRTLRLHGELYSEAAIQQALLAYQDFAHLELRSEEPYVLVDIEATADVPAERLEDELANYALALTIEQKRGQ